MLDLIDNFTHSELIVGFELVKMHLVLDCLAHRPLFTTMLPTLACVQIDSLLRRLPRFKQPDEAAQTQYAKDLSKTIQQMQLGKSSLNTMKALDRLIRMVDSVPQAERVTAIDQLLDSGLFDIFAFTLVDCNKKNKLDEDEQKLLEAFVQRLVFNSFESFDRLSRIIGLLKSEQLLPNILFAIKPNN